MGLTLPFPSSQRGMVLIIGIIFLIILTILGITAMNSSSLSEKTTQNMRDSSIAFEAAESALNDAQEWLQLQVTAPTPVTSCSAPPCPVWQLNILSNPYQQSNSWWQSNGTPYSSNIAIVAAQPRYLIEQYSFVPYDLSTNSYSAGRGYYYYQITARGVGATSNAIINLQSIYCVQFK